MDYKTSYSTWAEIDLEAIRSNITKVRQATGVKVLAVVKANAYGHGVLQVSKAALEGGAAWLGVALVDEALEIRKAGITCPLLLLSYTPPDRIDEVVHQQVSLTIWTRTHLALVAAAAEKLGMVAKVQLKVDTGMSRVGVQVEDMLDLVEQTIHTPQVHFEGLCTHFACADEIDPVPTDWQEQSLQQVLGLLRDHEWIPPLVHAANSATTLTRVVDHFNMVRVGVAMYGLQPSHECRLPAEFHPALTWKTVLSHVKTLPPGRGVSYGHQYTTSRNERIGTIPLGYADGFRRADGNVVLVCGKRVPVVGRVCMDQSMLQLDEVPEAQVGDEVVIVGQQGEQSILAEDVGRVWGTINYEVVCGIGARVQRFYHDSAKV
jgi:alanine racemase